MVFAKTAVAVTLATLALAGPIKRSDSTAIDVMIPNNQTLAQFTDAWKSECDKLFAASAGGVYVNDDLVQPTAVQGEAIAYCSWYTERPTTVYNKTKDCADALGAKIVDSSSKSKRDGPDMREIIIVRVSLHPSSLSPKSVFPLPLLRSPLPGIPQGNSIAQLNQTWTAQCHKTVDGKNGTFYSSIGVVSNNKTEAYAECVTSTPGVNGTIDLDNYTHDCANALNIEFAQGHN
ncbi:hypothetical protein CONPUDRAFT_160278 [Coniophora puteana RWD-64-598 SS2]|uniref:Uncharacterized protein n=1 Tax=Coniophora puteana (strain RWD-64-598) TaxID=741705 RepID=R7SET2_CONPW|nr:uncharacterized protein CONPUDRAFT_160278 [Coniophora puteana RWD-64-598 SS2]EIW74232.1 hypothetical protein CONPUDRAFT_160278 [Coniophora puteana RWD-64-598 SS2]